MSTNVLPTLPGLTYDVQRSPMWDTIVQQASSGKETRIGLQTYPRWRWELIYSILRADSVNTEFQQLVGFFNNRQGMFDTFLYSDADDYSTLVNLNNLAQSLGTGDGTTKAFQLIRSFGLFVEPVLAPNVISAVYLNGLSVPALGLSAPVNGALSQTVAGALAAFTYFVKSAWVNASGVSIAGGETSLGVLSGRVLRVAAPGSAPVSALGWNVYVSKTSGNEWLQNGATIPLGTPWVMPNTGALSGGTAAPATDSTGWSSSAWGATNPGVLSFLGAVSAGVPISTDFTYYWPCRFDMDTANFNLFMRQWYGLKKLTFQSVKN